jgi:type II secretory pathway pseudopilin PulG
MSLESGCNVTGVATGIRWGAKNWRSATLWSPRLGHRRAGRRVLERGATLVELMIYLAVMAIVGVPVVMVTVSLSRASAEGDMTTVIQERNRSAIQRIVSEYQESLKGTTTIAPDGMSLQFTSNGGFNGTTAIAGPVIRYEIRIDAKETVNGKDDNGNGLSDEGTLVRIDKSSGQEVVLTNTVKTSASSFAANGQGATINLTTFGTTAKAKEETAITRSISLVPRN